MLRTGSDTQQVLAKYLIVVLVRGVNLFKPPPAPVVLRPQLFYLCWKLSKALSLAATSNFGRDAKKFVLSPVSRLLSLRLGVDIQVTRHVAEGLAKARLSPLGPLACAQASLLPIFPLGKQTGAVHAAAALSGTGGCRFSGRRVRSQST